MMPKIGIIVGTRGRGSNALALIEATKNSSVAAQVRVVIGSRASAPALAAASERGVNTTVVPHDENLAESMLTALEGCELVCLAGYLRLLPVEVLDKFPHRILNIHPSLLPKFGGKGMYGHHVHEAVLQAGETESGCTVHEVNEVYDDGRIVLQKRCPVLPGDTVDSLAARVLELEHRAYPEAVMKVLRGG